MNGAEIAGQARELLPLLVERRAAAFELAGELGRLALNRIELLGECPDLAVEILTALFQHDGATDLGQHQQQDDRAKAATDAVEKRQAEHFDRAAPAHYGQSLAGMSKLPSLVRARCQKRVGRLRIALHGQQHAVDRDMLGKLAQRFVEQAHARVRVDQFAVPHRFSLGRQSIGDEDDLVGQRAQGPGGRECVIETRAVAGHDGLQHIQAASDLRQVAAGDPLSGGVRQQRLRLGVECVDLVRASGRDLRQQPVHGLHGALPFGGGTFLRIIRIAKPQDTDNVLVQHAGGNVQQNENAPAMHSQARDVTAVAAGLPEGRDILTWRRQLIAACLESLRTFLQGLDVSPQLLDALLARQAGRVVARHLGRSRGELRHHDVALCGGAGDFGACFLQRVAQALPGCACRSAPAHRDD